MTDQITVNVEEVRARMPEQPYMLTSLERYICHALAEHDKAEQERLGRLVFIQVPHAWEDTQLPYLPGYGFTYDRQYGSEDWAALTPMTVEALGEFYPHQTDHAYLDDGGTCAGYEVGKRCDCPEWAHTPPVLPDWQTDPDVLVVEDRAGDLYVRNGNVWESPGVPGIFGWTDLEGPITPVGWRRDPNSITLPGALRDRSADWWRDAANHGAKQGYPRYVNMACRFIADVLEAGQ